MTFEEFGKYLNKAADLRVGMITFLGGEPLLWKSIYDAIALCSQRHILTDLTTNGTLLNEMTIDQLGKAGLDFLNISVDGTKKSPISSKNSIFKNQIFQYLKKAKSKYRMRPRLNSVIYKNNFEDLKPIIEYSKENNIQLSLGYVVPPIDSDHKSAEDIYFGKHDTELLQEIISYILKKKSDGYPIIDPESYFENIFRFLDRDKFWECNYPTRYGWINVAPSGKVRSCTKKMDELDIHFLNLDPNNLRELRRQLKEKVRECNIDCYSNCAYDSYFYTHHKLQMLKKILSRLGKKNIN